MRLWRDPRTTSARKVRCGRRALVLFLVAGKDAPLVEIKCRSGMSYPTFEGANPDQWPWRSRA